MQITLGKLVSLGIAISYAALAMHWGGVGYWKWSLGLLVPLSLIWFPDEIGNLTGYYKSGYVNVQTPGVIVSFLGWFALVGLPVFAIRAGEEMKAPNEAGSSSAGNDAST